MESAGGSAERRCHYIGRRTAASIDVQQPGTDSGDGRTGRQALNDSREDQVREALRVREEDHRSRLDERGDEQHRASPDVIRQPSSRKTSSAASTASA